MKRRFPDHLSAVEARYEAQKLAFGPLMFQAARVLRESGSLAFLRERGMDGTNAEELSDAVGLRVHAARVLLEAGHAGGLLHLEGERYILTRVGYLVLRDPMTEVNMNFVHHVCYQPMFHLQDSIEKGEPVGLREHGEWKTVFEGLAELPEPVRRSWFAFDHYYSDGVFDRCLPVVFATKPKRLLDVGGNTGKFALACCAHDPNVQVTIVDLPGQLAVALEAARDSNLSSRIAGQFVDLLDPGAPLPAGYDAIWMSQFLDCFGEDEIVSILSRTAAAMDEGSRLFILETFLDRQDHAAAHLSLVNTSLYFTAVANGKSKMYRSERMEACLAEAGLVIEEDLGEIGFHTLLRCRVSSQRNQETELLR